MVPFGDSHIFFSLNSSTRCSSGVMVIRLVSVGQAQVVVLEVDVEVRVNELSP
jgi:hypothetical protein